jgi:hypothetical protein
VVDSMTSALRSAPEHIRQTHSTRRGRWRDGHRCHRKHIRRVTLARRRQRSGLTGRNHLYGRHSKLGMRARWGLPGRPSGDPAGFGCVGRCSAFPCRRLGGLGRRVRGRFRRVGHDSHQIADRSAVYYRSSLSSTGAHPADCRPFIRSNSANSLR